MGGDVKNLVLGKKYHKFCGDKDELSGYREGVRLLTEEAAQLVFMEKWKN